jgi:hypothetical protein
MEAVISRLGQREVGAYGPQDDSAFTARTEKLDFSSFNVALCQKFVALPAAKIAGAVRLFGSHDPCSAFTLYKYSVL